MGSGQRTGTGQPPHPRDAPHPAGLIAPSSGLGDIVLSRETALMTVCLGEHTFSIFMEMHSQEGFFSEKHRTFPFTRSERRDSDEAWGAEGGGAGYIIRCVISRANDIYYATRETDLQ